MVELLVNVHVDGKLDVALTVRARIIGVDNHKLDTMVVNISTTKRMDNLMKEMGLSLMRMQRGS